MDDIILKEILVYMHDAFILCDCQGSEIIVDVDTDNNFIVDLLDCRVEHIYSEIRFGTSFIKIHIGPHTRKIFA